MKQESRKRLVLLPLTLPCYTGTTADPQQSKVGGKEAVAAGPLLDHFIYLSIGALEPGCTLGSSDHACPFDRWNTHRHMSLKRLQSKGVCTAAPMGSEQGETRRAAFVQGTPESALKVDPHRLFPPSFSDRSRSKQLVSMPLRELASAR